MDDNPYRAPNDLSHRSEEDDIAAAAPPMLARIAGGVVVLAGLVVLLTAVQTWMLLDRIYPPYNLGPDAELSLGVPSVIVGAMVFRARAWAAMAAIGLSGLMLLVSAVWLAVSFTHGLFSLFALGAPFLAIAAFVLGILALDPCRRATQARARLAAQGMNLGL
jgi:hypothetical protein